MHTLSTVCKVAKNYQSTFVLSYLDIIYYSDKQNYMDFLDSKRHVIVDELQIDKVNV